MGTASQVVGGHNLNTQAVHYQTSTQVVPGQIMLASDHGLPMVLLHPNDMPKLASLVRTASIEAQNPRLKDVLEGQLATTGSVGRPRSQGLLYGSGLERGLSTTVGAGVTVGPLGWKPTRKTGSSPQANPGARLSSLGVPALMIERTADGTFRVFTEV